jgi:hypothetical protein
MLGLQLYWTFHPFILTVYNRYSFYTRYYYRNTVLLSGRVLLQICTVADALCTRNETGIVSYSHIL